MLEHSLIQVQSYRDLIVLEQCVGPNDRRRITSTALSLLCLSCRVTPFADFAGVCALFQTLEAADHRLAAHTHATRPATARARILSLDAISLALSNHLHRGATKSAAFLPLTTSGGCRMVGHGEEPTDPKAAGNKT
jgi:hypothetical protein